MWIGRDSKIPRLTRPSRVPNHYSRCCTRWSDFKGEAFLEADKTIVVVKSVYVDDENVEKAHYDGLYSIPGFMNRSYFCYRCCKGYNIEDSAHNNCQAKNCPACKQSSSKSEQGCPDFSLWSKPDRSCKVCRCEFHGEQCFKAHLIEEEVVDKALEKIKQKLEQDLEEELPSIVEMKSVCDQYRKCKVCLVSCKVKEDVPHKCLHAKCKHCLEFLHIYDHQCFITSGEEKQFKRTLLELRRQKKKKEQLLRMMVEGLPDDHTQKAIDDLIAKRQKKLKELDQINSGVPMTDIKAQCYEERLNDSREKVMLKMMEEERFELDDITLELVEDRTAKQQDKAQQTSGSKEIFAGGLVFADIESIHDSTNTFIPILICYSRGYSKTIFNHWGTNCVDLFIQMLLQWVKDEKGVQEFHIFFHNLKGFYHELIVQVELQSYGHHGPGTKMLHFKHTSLTFKDSLSFLNITLANFTNTFGLVELKNGWFSHKFSKLENLQYEGKIPDLKYFETQHMDGNKKEECEKWHAEHFLKGDVWNFQSEMSEYCKSDVKLMKEGCVKFAEDAQRDVGFNSLTQCITMASTTHYFWRNHQMQPKTIPVEPPHGWGGLKTSQSKIAFQWL